VRHVTCRGFYAGCIFLLRLSTCPSHEDMRRMTNHKQSAVKVAGKFDDELLARGPHETLYVPSADLEDIGVR
jgi:hypothetical protein